MKTKKIILSLGMLLFFGSALFAQTFDESLVKILPANGSDMIKVHYAMETSEPLNVQFFTKERVIGGDKIKGGPFAKGVSKRYDVHRFNDQDFWVKVSSSAGSVTYRIVTSPDKQTFTPILEDISPKPLLAEAKK